jgi:general secretion pathway protein G
MKIGKWPVAKGFTLIELMVVMAVLAVLAGVVTPIYLDRVEDAREVTLKHNLTGLRTAIDQYVRDQGKYPDHLQRLVTKGYIRAVPVDPITQSSKTWVVVPPPNDPKAVYDVKSGAKGNGKDGTDYGTW